MLERVREEFPELYTKHGRLRRSEPKRFVCPVGHEFNGTKKVTVGGIQFGRIICPKCNRRGQEKVSYSVWKRMINGQIEAEDFILSLVEEKGRIRKEQVIVEMEEHFGLEYNTAALPHLVYFGYLNVDETLRDDYSIVQYSINPEKDLDRRYERIQ